MELVVDANILFSALLRRSTTRTLIFNNYLKLYAPKYLLAELDQHLEFDSEIKEKLEQTKEETKTVIGAMLQSINIIQICEYAPFVNQALELSPDEYDAPYFAAAIYLCVPLWSNDKRLKKQNTVKVFNTQEILQLISKD